MLTLSSSQAQRIHSMFPHIPLEAITLDLADTHSMSLTVERIINDVIYIPGQDEGTGDTPSTPSPPSQPHTGTDAQHLPLTAPQASLPMTSPLTSESLPTHTPSPSTPAHTSIPPTESKLPTESLKETSTLRKRNLSAALRPTADHTHSEESGDDTAKDRGGISAAGPIGSVASPPETEVTEVKGQSGGTGHVGNIKVKGHKDESFASFAALLDRKEKLLENARR